MPVLDPQDLVDDVAVAGQQDQALAVLVEAADGKDALRMVDVVDDVARERRGAAPQDQVLARALDDFQVVAVLGAEEGAAIEQLREHLDDIDFARAADWWAGQERATMASAG